MIVLGCDHAGFELKNKIKKWLEKNNIKFIDVGAENLEPMDSYVDYAKKAAQYFNENCNVNTDKIILICGSGVGMSIVANKCENVRAVLCWNVKQAKQSRQHNNANCVCVGARNTCYFNAKRIINAFLTTDFLGGKYTNRVNAI